MMRADLVALGVRLNWHASDDKEEPAVAAVMERLRHEGEGCLLVYDNAVFPNGFRAQWEQFLRYVAEDAPYAGDLWAGARGVQLAELGLKSSAEGRRLDVPEITL